MKSKLLLTKRTVIQFSSFLGIFSMLVLPGTLTINVKSINSNWSNTGLTGSPPTDSETHLALVTCYNT